MAVLLWLRWLRTHMYFIVLFSTMMKMMTTITMMSSGKFMLGKGRSFVPWSFLPTFSEYFLYNILRSSSIAGYPEKFGTILVTRNQYLKIMTRQNFDVWALSWFLVSIMVGFLCDGNTYCFFPFILSASSYLLMGSTVACRRVTPGSVGGW